MGEGRVRTDVADRIGWLVLDNPDRRNAMDLAMYAAVPDAVQRLRAADVAVVIVRGAGDEAFGAGSDISEFRRERTGPAARRYNDVEHRAQQSVRQLEVPVIAMIRGACMGGGIGMAAAADIRYAADDAVFAVPPARLGVGYDPRAVVDLVAALGPTAARELLLTARRFDAREALRLGFVNAVVAAADLESHVTAIARRITTLAPLTLRAVKRASYEGVTAATVAAADRCYSSEDYLEGIAAFTERRDPVFRGR